MIRYYDSGLRESATDPERERERESARETKSMVITPTQIIIIIFYNP